MSATSTRPLRKSSLAATRANSAPWGLVGGAVSRRPDDRQAAAPATRGAGSANVSNVRGGHATASHASRSRTDGDVTTPPLAGRGLAEQRFMAGLIATVVGLTLAMGTMGARASFAASDSKARIGGTLGRASLHQMEFRARNARFAFWDELAASGARLPEGLTVVASNATASHWYLQVRDGATGVVCARVGQLNDPPVQADAPRCEREWR